MPRIRVLFAWEGNNKPFPPLTVVDVDDATARDQVRAGYAEIVSDDTPVSVTLRPGEEEAGSGGSPPATEPAPATSDPSTAGTGDASPPTRAGDDASRPDELLGSAREVVARIAELDDVARLEELKAAEEAGRNARSETRKTVVAAIEERLRVLAEASEAAPADEADDEDADEGEQVETPEGG